MKPKLPLLLTMLFIFSVSLIAQNNPALNNIDTAYLKQLIRQHKHIHFVFTQNPSNPIKFYELPQKVQPLTNVNSTAFSTQSNFHLVKDINTQNRC